MRTRKQTGQVIRIGDRWYVRYWERRNIGGNIERKRVTHQLGEVTTRAKNPPADVMQEAERHMSKVNGTKLPPERIPCIRLGRYVRFEWGSTLLQRWLEEKRQ